MQKVNRLILISLLTTAATAEVWAKDASPQAIHPAAEYKRAEANFYPKAELLKANPTIVIIPKNELTQKGDSYFFTPKIRAPKNIYVETLNDWIEPITPPGATSLGIGPDEMQIREPQGDVQVALPSAPANFAPATAGMTLPNGAVIKTGANGTAAVLFGGVDSARLMPNSAAAVQQTVTAQSRSAEVDLTAGGVFSKVGTQEGVKGNYEVHTPFGNASAQGGDFVTIITSNRTDVWVAQGNVSMDNPSQSKSIAAVNSDGTGPLKVMRVPGIADPHQAMQADMETLTAILNFIPLANQKTKPLRDKMVSGKILTANEQAYLNRIRQVPSLIKLALVEPPAPALAPKPIAVASPPATAPVVKTPARSAPLSPANLKPITVVVYSNGMVKFQGSTIDLPEFQLKLQAMVKTAPDQAILIKAEKTVPYDKVKTVTDACAEAHVQHVSFATPPPAPPTQPTPPTTPVVVPTPAPPPQKQAVANSPAPVAAPVTTPAPTSVPAPAPPPTGPAPMRAVVRVDGKVNFQGATYELPGFKSKLEALMKMTPDQAIVIKAAKTVPTDKIKAIADTCADAHVQHVTFATPVPVPPYQAPPPPTLVAAPEPAPEPPPPTGPAPIRAVVRVDGKINFQDATYELPGFKTKLEAFAKTTPDQTILIKAGKTVPYEKLKAVFDVCRDANVKYVSVAEPALAPATAEPEPAAANLPTPGLIMHPSLEPASSNTPSSTPTTNAPPPAGP